MSLVPIEIRAMITNHYRREFWDPKFAFLNPFIPGNWGTKVGNMEHFEVKSGDEGATGLIESGLFRTHDQAVECQSEVMLRGVSVNQFTKGEIALGCPNCDMTLLHGFVPYVWEYEKRGGPIVIGCMGLLAINGAGFNRPCVDSYAGESKLFEIELGEKV